MTRADFLEGAPYMHVTRGLPINHPQTSIVPMSLQWMWVVFA